MTGTKCKAVWTALLALAVAVAAPAMALAATMTGSVRNEAGTGLANVDLDFIELCSGDNIFLFGDKTAADGTFNVVVPIGNFDVRFTPPAGSTVVAGELRDIVISASASLGIVTLHPGRLVSGTVLTPALAAAAGVELKFIDRVTENRVYVGKDVTNALGQWSARVPPGTWDLDCRPPLTLPYADAERFGLVVGASDIAGLVDTLRAGFNITGDVIDENGNKLKNVNVDATDDCTGRRIGTSHDKTDLTGNYSIYLPAATYTFNYNPPRCLAVEAARTKGFTVDRDQGIGTEQLKLAMLVGGTILDDAGAPLANAKLKFYDVTTVGAPRQGTTHDHTDVTGAFSVYVRAGTYNIIVEPPVGKLDQVGHIDTVVVAAPTNVGTLQLAAGVAVSGHVAGPGNVPALNVNINAIESTTRIAQRLAHDDTDELGNFTIVLAPGIYDIQYDPPACDGLAPTSQSAQVVSGTTALPVMNLVLGVHALGIVVDGGALPVPSVDLDFYSAGTTNKIYTPHDKTDIAGGYDVLVPPATYDIRYIPPALTRLRPVVMPGTVLAVTQTLPPAVMAFGWLVSGFVRDTTTLLPIAGVAVDFYVPGSITPLWTPHHTSKLDGSYTVVVDAGIWDLQFLPAVGLAYAPTWRTGVHVAADTTIADALLQSGLLAVPEPHGGASVELRVWPNPARRGISVTFAAPAGPAEVSAWDLAGRRVATLWNGRAETPVTTRWNGAGDDGQALPSGIYFIRLASRSGASPLRRVVLVH